MNPCRVARRLAALILVFAVCTIGMPPAASAAGDEPRIGAPHHALTLYGQPLAQLLNATAITRGALLLGGPLEQGTGRITGVALGVDGAIIGGEAVQLRHVGPPTTVVDRTTTDANGRFAFVALSQGRYIADLRVEGRVVATSGLISLAEGGMTFIEVGGVAARQSTIDDEKGKGVLFWTAVGAGVGGAFGLVSIAGTDCDHAENMCPLPPLMGTTLGALGGLMFGLGR